MSVVFLFAGQGAQKVGMGRDLVDAIPSAAALFSGVDTLTGLDLTKVMFEGPDEMLKRTGYCQPALYLHGIALAQALRERLPALQVAACAGLSLGEFTAHAAAGTFSVGDGLKLVAARGRFMDEACAATEGAMAAMIGGEEAAVRSLAAECDVDVANLNAPGQIVLSGSRDGIAAAIAGAKAKGIVKAIALPVAGAYHSRLMKSAQEKLAPELAATAMQEPAIPVIANVTAQPATDPAEIRTLLERQVTGSTRWAESMQHLRGQGHEVFIEFSPDGALANMFKRIDKAARVIVVSDAATLDRAVAELAG